MRNQLVKIAPRRRTSVHQSTKHASSKGKNWPTCPCHRRRVEFVVCKRYIVRTVFPGNPREEWLWFKYCRRKGIFLFIRPSGAILFRQVTLWVVLIVNISLIAKYLLSSGFVLNPVLIVMNVCISHVSTQIVRVLLGGYIKYGVSIHAPFIILLNI